MSRHHTAVVTVDPSDVTGDVCTGLVQGLPGSSKGTHCKTTADSRKGLNSSRGKYSCHPSSPSRIFPQDSRMPPFRICCDHPLFTPELSERHHHRFSKKQSLTRPRSAASSREVPAKFSKLRGDRHGLEDRLLPAAAELLQ